MEARTLEARLKDLFALDITAEQGEAFLAGLPAEGPDDPMKRIELARIYAAKSRSYRLPCQEAQGPADKAKSLFLAAWDQLGRPNMLRDLIVGEMVATPVLAREGLSLILEHGVVLPEMIWVAAMALRAAGTPENAASALDQLTRRGAPPDQSYLRYGQAASVRAAVHQADREMHTAIEKVRAAAAADGVGPILFVTQPKSGTVYLNANLCEAATLLRLTLTVDSFPQDHIVPAFLERFAKGGALASEHMDASAATLDALAGAGVRKILVHVRDPRQAAVSWHHHAMDRLVGSQFYLRLTETPPIPDDLEAWPEERQKAFIVESYFMAATDWVEGWWRAARSDARFEISFSEFADMRRDPEATLKKMVAFFDLGHRFDESKVEKPQKGKRHYRKGSTDEWRGVFDQTLKDRMWQRLSAEPGMADHFGWAA